MHICDCQIAVHHSALLHIVHIMVHTCNVRQTLEGPVLGAAIDDDSQGSHSTAWQTTGLS